MGLLQGLQSALQVLQDSQSQGSWRSLGGHGLQQGRETGLHDTWLVGFKTQPSGELRIMLVFTMQVLQDVELQIAHRNAGYFSGALARRPQAEMNL